MRREGRRWKTVKSVVDQKNVRAQDFMQHSMPTSLCRYSLIRNFVTTKVKDPKETQGIYFKKIIPHITYINKVCGI